MKNEQHMTITCSKAGVEPRWGDKNCKSLIAN
jgi:hypothetical protein